MRLIDADNLIKLTKKDMEFAFNNGFLDMAFEREHLIKVIRNQPTAYSVDKVVEELEELKMRYFLTIANTEDEKSDFAYENVGNALDKAIEIVKQGGATKSCNNCANYTEPDEVDNGCYLCCKGYEDNYEPKVDNGGVGKDVE